MRSAKRVPARWPSVASAFLLCCAATAERVLAVPCYGKQRPVCSYENDFVRWLTTSVSYTGHVVGGVGFETLPDGRPAQGGEHITPEFNYTDWGVTFSSPVGTLSIAGLPGHDQSLRAFAPLQQTWIEAQFTSPAFAAGIYFGGGTTLYAYDVADNLIAAPSVKFYPDLAFLGILSEIPISRVVVDRGDDVEDITSFLFIPTPEPTSLPLFALLFFCFLGRPTHRYCT